MKKIAGLSISLAFILAGCSWSTDQLGPKGSVVVQGLEMQADAQCKTIGPDYVPEVFSISYKNRVFNYDAQRASAVIKYHCVKQEKKK